jgi:hypothetical protein
MKKEAPRKGGFPHLLCAVQNGGDPQNKWFWKCGNDVANALKKGLLPQKNNSDNCIQPQGKRMYEEGLLQQQLPERKARRKWCPRTAADAA